MIKPQIHILIVEDDLIDRMACRRALAQNPDNEFVLVEAETAREGLQLALAQKPDCILLDYNLPDLNGLGFLDELSIDPGKLPIPVIMLTGADNAKVAVEAMKRGAQDYLVKDVNRQYLEFLPTVIQRVMRERHMLTDKQHAEAKYRSLVEQIPAITYTAAINRPCKLLYISPQLKTLGYSPEAWVAETDALHMHIHPDDQARVEEAFEHLRSTGEPMRCEYRLLSNSGEVLWFRDEARLVLEEAGNPLFIQGILLDISESKRVEQELREHRYRLEDIVTQRTTALTNVNEQLQQDIVKRRHIEEALYLEKERAQFTLESIGDAVIATDASGRIEYLNPVATQFTGWSAAEAQGQSLQKVFNIIDETTRKSAESPVERCLREGRAVELINHSILLRRDGSELTVADTAAPIHDRQGKITGAVMVFHDVTKERKLTQQLSYQATHDALTGLTNRRDFEQRLERTLENARTEGADHALCFLDLDRFKVINDNCGHAAGDQLLRQLSAMLLEQMRSRDTLARLGGDEFGLLLEHCRLEQAWIIAEEMLQAVQQFKFIWEGKIHSVGVSIGVVPITSTSESLSAVLRAADAACYTAKGRGRNRIHIYQADDAELAQRSNEMQWVARITQALEEDRFGLFYQPIAELDPHGKQRANYEILVRMLEPDGQIIAPEAFLPAAERYNLMPTIDRWVVRKLLSWLAALPVDSEQRAAMYSINLSSASLADRDMLDFIQEQLILHQVPAQMLGFEIAETTAFANLAQATHFFKEIKNLGCRTTLDNFGNAMSSIACLNLLKMDYLKIDGSYIKDIAEDRIAHALVEAINKVAHEMSAITVGEWTENPAILGSLRKMGVDHAQGYAISRPRSLAELGAEQSLPLKTVSVP